MNKITNNSFYLLCLSAFLISIAMTPWLNSDSLIIPKVVILFSTALFLLPRVFKIYFLERSNIWFKLLIFFTVVWLIQLSLVLLNTDSPFEQQIFGRTGRGVGFLTELSLTIFLLISFLTINIEQIKTFFIFLITACYLSTFYSLMQRFNLDVFDWNTRTNGIIGTIGNPNFQSSFAAITLAPAAVYFYRLKNSPYVSIISIIPLLGIIYFAQSTQGYLLTIISFLVYLLVYFWLKSKKIFYIFLTITIATLSSIAQGMLNKGPLANFLYKPSVRSRGEMLRNSLAVANDNPKFGVGLDSLGDYYLIYKDARTVQGVNEFTDHAHNSVVNYAATGGYLLAILQILLITITLIAFLTVIKKLGSFNENVTALFCAWICFQAQSMISPATITLIVWNMIISGSIIGIAYQKSITSSNSKISIMESVKFSNPFSYFLLLLSLLIYYPYFNVDKMQQDSAETGNANLAITSALSYPESTIRYSRIGQLLIAANLAPQALDVGRAAAKFNPNAPSAWGLILVNKLATVDERKNALTQLQRLDPTNQEIKNFVIP